jgi:hypothetical protein
MALSVRASKGYENKCLARGLDKGGEVLESKVSKLIRARVEKYKRGACLDALRAMYSMLHGKGIK